MAAWRFSRNSSTPVPIPPSRRRASSASGTTPSRWRRRRTARGPSGVLIGASGRSEDLNRALLAGCAHPAVLRVILDSGLELDVDTRGDQGKTPLICAAASGSVEAVSMLLDAGADKSETSDDGRTALEWARDAGHEQVITVLRRHTTNP